MNTKRKDLELQTKRLHQEMLQIDSALYYLKTSAEKAIDDTEKMDPGHVLYLTDLLRDKLEELSIIAEIL